MGDAAIDIMHALSRGRRVGADGKGVLIGLVGRGIQSSRTPAMHEREAERIGLACTYRLVDFDRHGLGDDAIGDVIAAAARSGFHGLNVTHPFKQTVIPHLDALSPEAEAIGAVNTVVFGAGGTVGHNTDSWGFADSFRQGLRGATMGRVVQFGAGGAGAAVAFTLLELGVRDLHLVDRDTARAHDLAERLHERFGDRVSAASGVGDLLRAADGVVNATPVGMAKYPGCPFDPALLSPRHWVGEIIYFPVETELLRRARLLGCRTLAGTGMAIGQAVRAFELFTGHQADSAAMASHFDAAA